MKSFFPNLLMAIMLMFVGCTKTDSYQLTDAAHQSLEVFVGQYQVAEMRWDGPEVDIDMDGVPDTVLSESQVYFGGGRAVVSDLERMDKEAYIDFDFPVSRLDDTNGGRKYYSPANPQMIMWVLRETFTVDSKGTIKVKFEDTNVFGQYLKNFTMEFIDGGFKISADSHVWDFFTGKEVKGKLTTIYQKCK